MADIHNYHGSKPEQEAHQPSLRTEEHIITDEKDSSSEPSLLKPEAPLPAHMPTTNPSGNPSLSDVGDAEKAVVPVEEQKPPRDVHGVAWVLVVISILSSTFLFALDNTIVADVQPKIVERFGDISKLPWLSVSFLVAAAATNLIW